MNTSIYKIKVNKRPFTNSHHNIKLYIKKSNKNEEVIPISIRNNFSTSKSRQHLSTDKLNSVSNSTQRIKKTEKIKTRENNEDSILESLENNKYLKPILSSENINKKSHQSRIKESMKANLKIVLHDFFNRDKKHIMNLKLEPNSINYNNKNIKNHNKKDCVISNYKTIDNNNAKFNKDFRINSPKFYDNNSIEKWKLDFKQKNNKLKVYSSEKVLYNNYNKKICNNIMIENGLYNKINISFEKKSKYDYNKAKFYIYRDKLIKVFLKHIKNIIKTFIIKYFLFFNEKTKKMKKNKEVNYLNKTMSNYQNIKTFNNNENNFKEINKHKGNSTKFCWASNNNSSKATLQKSIYNNDNSIHGTNNINTSKYLFNRGKTNDSLRSIHNNIGKSIYNSSFLLYNSRNSSDNSKKKLQTSKKTLSNLRNLKASINKVDESSKFVYKKKLNLNNKSKILNKYSPENKIIDIKIDIGKPISAIRDLNPLDCHYLSRNYHLKHSNKSLSSNKKKHKQNSIKHIFLPNKKFLEEEDNFDMEYFSTSHCMKTFNPRLKTSTNNSQNIIKKNLSISKINNKNIKDNKIRSVLVKNITTSDKLLFIHIKYIYSDFANKNEIQKKFDQKMLAISNNVISIIKKKFVEKRHKQPENMSNSFLYKKISRNNIIAIERLNDNKLKNNLKTSNISETNDKYLNSCLKFLIKIINKLFLFKNYKTFKKIVYQKYIPKKSVRRKYRK